LYSILSKKAVLFFATTGSLIIGVVWPIVGLIIGAGVDSLSSTNPDIVKNESYFYAMLFIVLGVACGLGFFLQR
jgi:hypothetical protein